MLASSSILFIKLFTSIQISYFNQSGSSSYPAL
nr:MAG TPA: hypothetical protein [Caudoviricetes sp.]